MQRIFELINSMKSELTELDLLVNQLAPTEVSVNTGDELTVAFNSMLEKGGRIICKPGLTYDFNLVNPERPIDAPWITICSSQNLRPTGQMMRRADIPQMPKFIARNPVVNLFENKNKARNVEFNGIFFGPQAADRTVIALGGDRSVLTNPSETPSGFMFKHCVWEGDFLKGQHVFVRVHARDVTIVDSSMWDGFETARDSQGIAGWNGTDGLLIQNCHIEAGAENIMFGGAGSASAEMNPRNIIWRRVKLSKDRRWATLPNITIKCLFEIKNATNIDIDGLYLDNNWKDDWPHGWAMAFKSANQGGVEPWAECSTVNIKNVLVTDVGSILSIVANNDVGHPSRRMHNIKIENLLALRINQGEFLGTDMMVQMINTPDGLSLNHWTVLDTGHSILNGEANQYDRNEPGTISPTFALKNSIFCEGEYNVKWAKSTGNVSGRAALDAIGELGWEFTGNVIGKGARSITGIDNNVTLSMTEFNALFDADGRLVQEITQVQSTDGFEIGANVDKIYKMAIPQ